MLFLLIWESTLPSVFFITLKPRRMTYRNNNLFSSSWNCLKFDPCSLILPGLAAQLIRGKSRGKTSEDSVDAFALVRHLFSFFASNWLVNLGSARPPVCLITCPTKKPSSLVLPWRYCSSSLGFAATTCSMIASRAPASEI